MEMEDEDTGINDGRDGGKRGREKERAGGKKKLRLRLQHGGCLVPRWLSA